MTTSEKADLYRDSVGTFGRAVLNDMHYFDQQLRGRLGNLGPGQLQQLAQQRGFLRIEAVHSGLCFALVAVCGLDFREE